MAKLAKKLVSFFVEMEEDAPAAKTAPQAPAVVQPAGGDEDKNIADSLAKALTEANLAGFDYFEFAQLCKQLKPNMPSEQVLFQTAYTSGKVMGASKQKLVESANHYLSVLDKKQSEFQEAVKEQTDQTVTMLEGKLIDIDGEMKDKSNQIKALTEDINALAERQAKLTSEIAENKSRIEKVKANFTTTISKFIDRIKEDLEKVEKYIVEGGSNG